MLSLVGIGMVRVLGDWSSWRVDHLALTNEVFVYSTLQYQCYFSFQADDKPLNNHAFYEVK